MAERLFGMETEYAVSVLSKQGSSPLPAEYAAEKLYALANSLPHLPACFSSGIFLGNGSRFYVDCGHPELATAECANPWDVCRYLRAGDRMLGNLAARLTRADRRVGETLIFKSNVDYLSRTTWASHESYLHAIRDMKTLPGHIIPHLVSRIVFSGCGGFDCFSPGIDFMVSPRVAHLSKAVSPDSTGARGIFHSKDESLCGFGYHRLHILSGESLCSETATWLKVATTALVVALIEAGVCPGANLELADPVAAMRDFSADPSCRRPVAMADGGQATALAIQYEYLQHAEAHVGAAWMPPWSQEVCRHWREMLDRLSVGPEAVARTLDWATKLSLFQRHLQRANTTLESMAKWTPILTKLRAAYDKVCPANSPFCAELILDVNGPLWPARRAVTHLVERSGLQWDALARFFDLRMQLFEIDARYSLLGEKGIFVALEEGGTLDHHFPGVDNFQHALENPPAVGRAAIRGKVIRRLAGRPGRYAAEWDRIWDIQSGSELNLSDPFCTEEKWESSPRTPRRARPSLPNLFRAGRYAELLDQIVDPSALAGCDEEVALALARTGRVEEARSMVASTPATRFLCHPVALSMSILSSGLVPAVRDIAPLVESAERGIAEAPGGWDSYSRFVFTSYKGLWHLHRGEHAASEAALRSVIEDHAHSARTMMGARNRCFLAELYRRTGRRQDALDLAHAAHCTHRAEQLQGDMAFHSLPLQAKLFTDSQEATALLDLAESIHREGANPLGLAHTLCIRARRLKTPRDRAEIMALLGRVTILRSCSTAQRIRTEFETWIAPDDDPVGNYWGL